MLGTALQHARVLLRVVADEDALSGTYHPSAVLEALLIDALLEDRQALLLHLVRGVVGQVRGRGAGARAVDEGVGKVEADVLNQLHGLLEVLVGLAGEADDEVRADQDVRHCGLEPADARLVLQGGVVALHRREDAVGPGLHRQMQIFHQLRDVRMGLDDRVGELQGMAGGVADTADAVYCGDGVQQVGEVMPVVAIAIDVLPQQGDFLHAVFGQVDDFRQHVGQRAADFFAAGVGHHTEGAVLAAAFHD